MHRIFSLLLITLSPAAMALPPVASFAPFENAFLPLHKAEFIPAEEGLRSLRAPLNAMAASLKIEFVDRNGAVIDHCSGSVVSDSGTLLTAGHCVERCLKDSQALVKEDDFTVVDRARMNTVPCRIRINGQIVPAQILATNDCRGEDRYKTGNARISCRGLDYALLKIEAQRLPPGQPCFQVAAQVPAPGTSVAALGYPPVTARSIYKSRSRDSDAKGADGRGQFLTPGRTMAFQNQCLHDIDPTPREKPGPKIMGSPQSNAMLRRQVESGALLQTTTDLLPGLSGAGLVDLNRFELVGVARNRYENSATVECVGSGFYTSASAIVKDLNERHPDLDLSEVLKCEQNAFTTRSETRSPVRSPENPVQRSGESGISR